MAEIGTPDSLKSFIGLGAACYALGCSSYKLVLQRDYATKLILNFMNGANDMLTES